jgi:hypothetical protein
MTTTEPNGRQAARWIITSLALLLLVSGLGAYSDGRKTVEWKQEVPLNDGRVVVLERISKQTGTLFPENVSMEYEQTLTFVHPDTQERIRWTLPKGLQPAALYFEEKTPYYLLKAYTVADFNTWGCPNPPWLVYRYEKGEWNRVPFEQLPAKIAMRNLIAMEKTAYKFTDDRYVTADELKRFWESEYDLKRLKIISREKVNPIAKGCHESVLVKLGREAEARIGYEQQETMK